MEIQFKTVSYTNSDLKELIKQLDECLIKLYPERPVFGIELNNNETTNVQFIIGYDIEKPVCCDTLRFFNDNRCELKRMFVLNKYRGKGISKYLYRELEKIAKMNNKDIIILETGFKQLEAINLYQKLGFEKNSNYGEFINDDVSVCFSKKI